MAALASPEVHLLLMEFSLFIALIIGTVCPESPGLSGARRRTVLPGAPLTRSVTRPPTPCSIWREEDGAVAVVTALALTALIGFVGLAVDAGVWYRTNRTLQNAADAAVIAAALNGSGSYGSEAKAVAAQYGFVHGVNSVTVAALNNQTCPSPSTATDCYKVTVTRASAPRFFSAVLGIAAPTLSGAAMASSSATHNYCLLALAGSGTSPAIDGNGGSKANMNGCSLMSNSAASCSGHDLGATYGDAHGTNNGCGVTQHSNAPVVADPYSSLASSIPSNTCGSTSSSFPQKPSKPHDPALPGSNIWGSSGVTTTIALTSSPTIANKGIVCGDLQLAGDVTVTSSSGLAGSVLVIENGLIDTNGHTLKTASGSALTIIFTGPTVTGKSYNHYPTDSTSTSTSGTSCTSRCLDFMAPTSGTWKGIAIYQDPNLTSGVDFTYTGNSPTWNITGVAYFPHASLAFKGAVNKSSNGASCLLLIADNVTLSGTASIEATTTASCLTAGVTLPTNNVGGIALVM
jgi:Flp pilus assembly protein TadG